MVSGFPMRVRRGCFTVVPMPADVLSSCIALFIWVRLEARPFHIPPRIALLALYVTVIELCGRLRSIHVGEGHCDGFCDRFGICGLSMRLRHGCFTVVPMPADALLACFVVLPWVRLEARPFHIPPRIALLGWSRGFIVDYGGQLW